MDTQVQETGCCKRFDPAPWEGRELTWDGKVFIKDHVACFCHIPLNMGKKVVKNMGLIQKADAAPETPLMLCDDTSLWGCDIYIDVTKQVAGAEMASISGTFLTKVFEGPYSNAGKWMKQMQAYVAEKGRQLKKVYLCYTTCPACAKAYGKNYVVLFAQIG